MISNQNLRIHQISGLAPGPRLIVTGAVHGNETAGTKGIRRVLAQIDSSDIEIVRGSVTFVPVCNPLAYNHMRRMGDRNLNRRLQPTATPQDFEDRIANVLCPLLAQHEVLLDLHSFRSPGQPFVMRGPADNRGLLEPFAHEVAEARLAAHVGPSRIVEGWMSSYADGLARRKA
ncbi:MAG: succinylglutamate desuccinylase/aspartoacylase family protein, partial [Rubrivivax sp.]|nr:succinylglutamate desuccinylase/aspartoacylase family protein [Rubrivivax sp.]